MVRSAQLYGVSETARLFEVSRPTDRRPGPDGGMDLSQVVVQTDNGTEYISNSPYLSKKSAFEKVIDQGRAYDGFNHIRPNFPPTAPPPAGLEVFKSRWKRGGAYHQNQTPYQRMKRAGISSKTAEPACFWTVTILDDPKYKNLNFILPQSVNHVCKLDKSL